MSHPLPLLAAAVAVAIFAIAYETRPQAPSSVHFVQDGKVVEAFDTANATTEPTMLAGDQVNMAAVQDLMAKRASALNLSGNVSASQTQMLQTILGTAGR